MNFFAAFTSFACYATAENQGRCCGVGPAKPRVRFPLALQPSQSIKSAMHPSGTIGEILHHKGLSKGAHVWSISPNATVFEALQLMSDKDIGALLVLEADKLVGIISERDYSRKIVLKGKSSRDTPVKEILSGQVIQVTPSHTVEECMRLMTTHRVRHLPVLDDDRIVGLVSIGDLVNWTISAQSTTIHQLQTYIAGYPG
ncbi:Putative signal transduction protein with CBS domains (modular protein) [Verrucomicrobia bacterium]|nr:Putative signal transduction protein with CBS domains (modular protein) [Verrucomicrobiota bacterium]